jgi:serine/threonine protein kinase
MTVATSGPWDGQSIAEGRYQKLQTIGEGGMAYVYRAVDRNLRAHVVIKSPRHALIEKPGQANRFEHEIRALIQMSHPHIVPIIDVGRHEQIPYVVMRYLSGGSLDSLLAGPAGGRRKMMNPAVLKFWLPNIAAALDFVHRHSIVHRDVKPANILFDDHRQAYLSDFGIIRSFGSNHESNTTRLTRDGSIVGTVDYMAPELFTDEPVDGRADQYSLAVTVYEALAGRLPFNGQSLAAIMRQHLEEPAAPLTHLVRHIPPSLSLAVSTALAKNPLERFASCGDFASAVIHALTIESPANETFRSAAPATAEGRTTATPIVAEVVEAPGHNATFGVSSNGDTARRLKTETHTRPNGAAAIPGQKQSAGSLLITEPAFSRPVNSGPSQAKNRLLVWGGGAAVIISIVALLCVLVMESGDNVSATDSTISASLGSNPLPKLIADLNERTDELQRSMQFDSRPLINNPTYGSSAEFAKLLDTRSKKPATNSAALYESLKRDLDAAVDLHNQRAEKLQQLRVAAAKDGRRDGSEIASNDDPVRRDLLEQEAKLKTLIRRLADIQRASQSAAGSYDAEALEELATLREMETVVSSNQAPTITPATLRRAATLLDVKHSGLASLARNTVARSADAEKTALIVDRLRDGSAEQQAELCWSLLVSKSPNSIAAAVEFLNANPQLAAQFNEDHAIELVRPDPAAYQNLLPLLALHCQSSDARFALFCLQLPVMRNEWLAGIERACDGGLLRNRVDDMIVETVVKQHTRGYKLVERLLLSHGEVSLAELPAKSLSALSANERSLAGKLAEQFMLRGNNEQRLSAIELFAAEKSPVDLSSLERRLVSDRPDDPTALLNLLLASRQSRTLALADFIVHKVPRIAAEDVSLDDISDTAMSQKSLRERLLSLAWKVPNRGQAWALEAMLGSDFVKQFQAAEDQHIRQRQVVEPLIPILNGKIVSINNASVASGDKGLQIPGRELGKIPDDIQPQPWAEDGEAAQSLAQMRKTLADKKSNVPTLYRDAFEQLDQYLDQLEQLTEVSYQLTRIYDQTIAKQLPGVHREQLTRHLDYWDFRFSRANRETFDREHPRFAPLNKELARRRVTIPLLSSP